MSTGGSGACPLAAPSVLPSCRLHAGSETRFPFPVFFLLFSNLDRTFLAALSRPPKVPLTQLYIGLMKY